MAYTTSRTTTRRSPLTKVLKPPMEREESTCFEGLVIPSVAPSPLGGNWADGMTSTSSCMGHGPTFPVVPEPAELDPEHDEDAALTDDAASIATAGEQTDSIPTDEASEGPATVVATTSYNPYQPVVESFSRETTANSLAPAPIDDSAEASEESVATDEVTAAPFNLIHAPALQGHLGFLPYPQGVAFEELPAHIPPTSQAPFQNRVFLGHLWVHLGTSVVQWLIDSFALPIGCGHIAHLCSPQRHINKSGYYAGCAHAVLCAEQPENTNWIMGRLHKRILFDLDGVWFAETPEQQEHLLRYCEWLCRLPQHDRHALLQTLPCNPIAVEFSQNAKTTVPPPYAGH